MRFRVEFLKLHEPNEWNVDGRKGVTYKIEVLTPNHGSLPLRVSEDFYNALRRANFKRLSVLDIIFDGVPHLQNKPNGRPEQVLKIVPVGFEFVATSLDDVPSVVVPPLESRKAAGA